MQPAINDQTRIESRLSWHLTCLAFPSPEFLLLVLGGKQWSQDKHELYWFMGHHDCIKECTVGYKAKKRKQGMKLDSLPFLWVSDGNANAFFSSQREKEEEEEEVSSWTTRTVYQVDLLPEEDSFYLFQRWDEEAPLLKAFQLNITLCTLYSSLSMPDIHMYCVSSSYQTLWSSLIHRETERGLTGTKFTSSVLFFEVCQRVLLQAPDKYFKLWWCQSFAILERFFPLGDTFVVSSCRTFLLKIVAWLRSCFGIFDVECVARMKYMKTNPRAKKERKKMNAGTKTRDIRPQDSWKKLHPLSYPFVLRHVHFLGGKSQWFIWRVLIISTHFNCVLLRRNKWFELFRDSLSLRFLMMEEIA